MILEQRPVPPGAPLTATGQLTEVYVGWIDWVTKAVNAFLRGKLFEVVKITADYTMREIDCAILADATTGNIQITLVAASLASAKRMTVKKIDASGNTVTVLGTIDGAANLVLGTQYQSFDLLPDTTSNVWWLV